SQHWKLGLLGRTYRHWNDLHSVQLQLPPNFNDEIHWTDSKKLPFWVRINAPLIVTSLIFDFDSGGSADIGLSFLSTAQADSLLKGINKYANPSCFSPEVVQLSRALILGQTPSFTDLWQENLNTKYIATSYVPLRTDHVLQSGQYKVAMQLA